MRFAIGSLIAMLLASSASAQSLDIEVVQANDSGKLLITRTVQKQEQYTYTVQTPVSESSVQNGKVVTITRLVP